MRACGITVWSMKEWEADDALATGARRFAPFVDQVRILTPDKDLGQVVEGTRIVQVDRMRRKVIDETYVRTARGVGPASIPDLLGLVGDTADGIPGLPRFGAKSAAAVLARWGSIEAIPDDDRKWDVKVTGAPRLAKTLASMRSEALLYKKLATLVVDVPLKEDVEGIRFHGVPRGLYEALCDQLELRELRTRPGRWAD